MTEICITPFPCNSCGKCCKKVNASTETSFLDRGDGVCYHFDEITNLCSIYETRPLVCRVEDYYRKNLSEILSWDEFVELNMRVCRGI
ncbi:YkgJ family cysteine cluster protein [Providencia stuartii]|uniref:YkgJ family cysteine cluster protein n=1 Tax=Moellerella wisconsensis TaxID=158849 RepID=A0ACD3Y4Q1_9GAMM|nr:MULTISPECIES: YkgJ family cysteine cluster protein [Morganellaceae]UNH37955.1 YkgJ family cysteine cluster protein [Moellerella wisconsensis]